MWSASQAPHPTPAPTAFLHRGLLYWAPGTGGGSRAVCSQSLRRRLGWAEEARGRERRAREKGAGPVLGSWGGGLWKIGGHMR